MSSADVIKYLRSTKWLESARDVLFRWHRWIIVILGFFFIFLQLLEHPLNFGNLDPFHLVEVILFTALLVFLGYLIENLIKSIEEIGRAHV
jgi:hypothetical protein